MNRKNFLKSMALGAASTSILVAACGGDAPKTETTTAPVETPVEEPLETADASADCNDLSGLTEAEIKQREAVAYVTVSTEADKNCANCRFMQEGNQPNGCSGCQLFKGPIAPEGNCKSWFKKEA